MIRLALCLFLILGGVAMAKDGSIKAPRDTAPIDSEQQFWNSEEGQDIQRLFEDFRSGKKSFDQAHEEYNKKWADKPLPQPPAQAPDAPFLPIR